MKRILLLLALASSALAAKKPNIIVVMTDDQGYGPSGNTDTLGLRPRISTSSTIRARA